MGLQISLEIPDSHDNTTIHLNVHGLLEGKCDVISFSRDPIKQLTIVHSEQKLYQLKIRSESKFLSYGLLPYSTDSEHI